MRDAAVERLAKLISNQPSQDDGEDVHPRSSFSLHFKLEEGWFSLFLVATVVYSTIWSVQSAGWVDHLNILTLTTALGLGIGVVAAKQQRFPQWSVHVVVVILGLLLAFWQTAGGFHDGNVVILAGALQHWFALALNGGTSDDDSIFLLLILMLGYLLAYISAWLVYHARIPWLMIVANAVILLINLSNLDTAYALFLIVFLIAALLLLLRFQLFESVNRWRKHGLRYADDFGWDFMQAGVFITIGILIFSWLLPAGYADPVLSGAWSISSSPWVQVQGTWNRLIALNGGNIPANHGNFRNTLVLAGNPNLNQDIVFTVQTDGDGTQYLEFLSYDTYTSQGWSSSSLDKYPVSPHQFVAALGTDTHTEKQTIKVVNPPGEQDPYLGGASEITSVSLSSNVLASSSGGGVVAWEAKNGALSAGTTYTVTSEVSSADKDTLRSISMPSAAPPPPQNEDVPLSPIYYDQNIVKAYVQLPANLDPRIQTLAKQITANAPTMYDKATALETYLRSHYTYSVDIQRPPDQDGVSWFLFNSGNKGFCNYFASAMAVMARSVGIPARVVAGYTHGTFDDKQHQWVIRGSDAHAWTQIYFAGYGWINFEPSQSFAPFTRPLPNQFASSNTSVLGGAIGGAAAGGGLGHRRVGDPNGDVGGSSGTSGSVDVQAQLRQTLGALFGVLVLSGVIIAVVFMLWWRRLFARYDLAPRVYGRLCVLASWAGVRIQPSHTPYEYIQELQATTPNEATVLERLGDIYVRYRWADPESKEHPRRSGEVQELTGIWQYLQPRFFFHVLKHPYFLRSAPAQARKAFASLHKKKAPVPEEEF